MTREQFVNKYKIVEAKAPHAYVLEWFRTGHPPPGILADHKRVLETEKKKAEKKR